MTSAANAKQPSEELDKDIWKKVEQQFTAKRSSEFFDPCQDFADASIKCMRRNNSDKEMCQDYFKAYRDCKKEWVCRPRISNTMYAKPRSKLTEALQTLRRKEAKKAAGGSWFG